MVNGIFRRYFRIGLLVEVALAAALLYANGAVSTGPNVGQKVPSFRLQDQNGKERTLASIMGPKGALLVFYRSADW
jgi:hypothetical protein